MRVIDVYGEFLLDPGEYTAAVGVRLTSGAMLEYQWPITVVPELTWPGLPKGVYVTLLPESTISQAVYQRGFSLPPSYFPCDQSGICLGLVTSEIVERGEILDCGDVVSKVQLISLDGERPEPVDGKVWGSCELEKSFEIDFDGQEITSYPGPHTVRLWRVDLSPGEHTAVAKLTRASGEVERFAWRFTITEDD